MIQGQMENQTLPTVDTEDGASTSPDVPASGAVNNAANRRCERLEITRSISLIPTLPDGSPDTQRITYGYSIDLTLLGIGLIVERDYPIRLSRYVVGVEGDDGQTYFSSAAVRHTSQDAEGLRIGAEFLKNDNDLFCHRNIAPVLNQRNMKMQCGLSNEILSGWEQLGVLSQSVYDRVKICPACSAIPTFRDACKKCGSARVEFERMIHHYACAHVDLDAKFSDGDSLSCPKCRAHSMVVGADFEYLTGPYVCMDCNWKDTTLEQYCNCLGCNFRFPSHQAVEEEVTGYSVERLDSLAFFNQP